MNTFNPRNFWSQYGNTSKETNFFKKYFLGYLMRNQIKWVEKLIILIGKFLSRHQYHQKGWKLELSQ